MHGLAPKLLGQHQPSNCLKDDLKLAVIFALKLFEFFGEVLVGGEKLS